MGSNYCPNCGHEMNQGVGKQDAKEEKGESSVLSSADKKGVSKKASLVIAIMNKKKGKKS